MVRLGGMTYALDPVAGMRARVFDMRLNGLPLRSNKRYNVAGWAAGVQGEPVGDVLGRYLRDKKTIAPRLVGVKGNSGIA